MTEYLVVRISKTHPELTIQEEATNRINSKALEGWELHSLTPSFNDEGLTKAYHIVFFKEK